MRNILLFLFLSFTSEQCYAQKEAFNWIWGICTQGDSCELPYSVTIIKFGNDSIERIYSPNNFGGSFYAGSATISDSLGNFLMAFDGKYLYDSLGNVIQELTELPYGSIPSGIKSFIFLKIKNERDCYHLIYNYSKLLNEPIGSRDYCDSNIIDIKIKVNLSLGYEILSRDTINLPIISTPGSIECTRHANGRDWWILKSGFRRNSFLKGILSPDSLSFEDFTTEADTMYNDASIFKSFSSDGSKYFHFLGNNIRILDVYDFDRCTGELSNLRTFDFTELINEADFTPFNLSPNGNLLYFLRGNIETFRFENLVYDISNQTYNLMSKTVNSPCLSPNLKQMVFGHYKYNEDGTFDTFLSVLNEPNEYNEANLDTFAYVMPTWGYLRVPHNWANHMLNQTFGSILIIG